MERNFVTFLEVFIIFEYKDGWFEHYSNVSLRFEVLYCFSV